ncbi:MAG TPA: peptidylprolyl isomerase [Longimicrobiales bacterium]|nr:peptidylprolyl isomerase [Longimicrobiales bacterium]
MSTLTGFRRATVVAAACTLAACAGNPCEGPPPPEAVPAGHVLRNPDAPEMREAPPDSFDVRFETTQGPVTVRIYRDWAPLGAARFYNLARHGFYDGSRFYRVLPGFIAQFGMNGHPEVDGVWHERPLVDDPPRVSNGTGTLSYAKAGPDSRTTQLFFNYRANEALDAEDFAPIGRVIDGMGSLYLLNGEYGEMQPRGRGPEFGCMLSHGNHYLSRRYDDLDVIERVTVLPQTAP